MGILTLEHVSPQHILFRLSGHE